MFVVCSKCGYMFDDTTGCCPRCSAPEQKTAVMPETDNHSPKKFTDIFKKIKVEQQSSCEPAQIEDISIEATVDAYAPITENVSSEPLNEDYMLNETTVGSSTNAAQEPAGESFSRIKNESIDLSIDSSFKTGENTAENEPVNEPYTIINDVIYMDETTESIFEEALDPVVTIDNISKYNQSEPVLVETTDSFVDISSSTFDNTTVSIYNTSLDAEPLQNTESEPMYEENATNTIKNDSQFVIPDAIAENKQNDYFKHSYQQGYQPVGVTPMIYSATQNSADNKKKDSKMGILILLAILLGVTVVGGIILNLL